MKTKKMSIAFFASSLVSAYWNGAATYYRGIVRALHERGHRICFYEPDAYGRQQHRDIDDPDWAEVIVYPGEGDANALRMVEHARGADLVVKASGVGVFDALLEEAVLDLQGPATRVVRPTLLDTCARCGGAFHCGVADAGPCACASLRLSDALLAALRARYAGCLCLACLLELQADAPPPGA